MDEINQAAQAAAKNPGSYSLLTYAWIVALSCWGGAVSFVRRFQEGRPWTILELIGELVTSGFAGVLTFWGCEAAGIDSLIAAILVGVSGHMGTRAIVLFELSVKRRIGLNDKGDTP